MGTIQFSVYLNDSQHGIYLKNKEEINAKGRDFVKEEINKKKEEQNGQNTH